MEKNKMKTILIVGTLDTKEKEVLFIEKQIRENGFNVIILDTGSESSFATANHQKNPIRIINTLSGHDFKPYHLLRKEEYMQIVIERGSKIVSDFYINNEIAGILSIGGGTGSSIGTAIMQTLPRGFPKLMVSTVATGTTPCGSLVGTKDITLMHSIVDVQGINFLTVPIFANACGAICGMAEAYIKEEINNYSSDKITVALSMMGTTTKGALRAVKTLEKNGFQVISFHQNGTGGIAMEEMIDEGIFQGVFDLSLHEVGDRELGGLHGAIRPNRLETAGIKGIPQIVAPGCLVYYVAGPAGKMSAEEKKRKHFIHSPQLTLVRATPQELSLIGKVVAKKLNLAKGPVKVFIPLKGFCAPDKEGEELFDPEGNQAFIDSLKADLNKDISITEVNSHINDPEFIDLMTEEFIKILRKC